MKKFLSFLLTFLLIVPVGNINASVNELSSNNSTKTDGLKYIDLENIDETSNITIKTEEDMINEMRYYGVEESTINSLMDKYSKGEMWNSIDPDFKDSAVEEELEDGMWKYTYPDGSIRVSNAPSLAINNSDSDVSSYVASQKGYSVIYQDSFATVYRAVVVESAIYYGYTYFIDFTRDRYSSVNTLNSYTRNSLSVAGLSGLSEGISNNTFRIEFFYKLSINGVGRDTWYWCEAYPDGVSTTLKFRGN